MYNVELTADEVILLDGRCGPKIQAIVDTAKSAISISANAGLSDSMAKMISEIVTEAKSKGKLSYRYNNIAYCPCCKHSEGYHVHKRNGKYHRKGDKDYDNPKTFGGWEVADNFVTIKNRISRGFCTNCSDKVLPTLQQELKGVKAQIPDDLLGEKCRYKKYPNKHCTQCGWGGHEGEMIKAPTLMGDGFYPAKCPKCKAENMLFSTEVVSRDGFTIVEV